MSSLYKIKVIYQEYTSHLGGRLDWVTDREETMKLLKDKKDAKGLYIRLLTEMDRGHECKWVGCFDKEGNKYCYCGKKM